MSQPTSFADSLALAEAARQTQLRIRAQLLRDVTRAWPLLDLTQITRTWPDWLRVMTALINRYHATSSDQAGLFYRATRQAVIADAGTTTLVRIATTPTAPWITRALGYAAPGTFARQIDMSRTPDHATKAALTQVLGTASRISLDGARTTIQNTVRHDNKAIGWYRVTDGRPCAFCALLAARGIVYKSTTVGFQAHNDCGCTGAPAFTRDQELPAISRLAAQVYTERGSGNALVAFRKAWNARETPAAA